MNENPMNHQIKERFLELRTSDEMIKFIYLFRNDLTLDPKLFKLMKTSLLIQLQSEYVQSVSEDRSTPQEPQQKAEHESLPSEPDQQDMGYGNWT